MDEGRFDALPHQGTRLPLDDDAAAGEWALAYRLLRDNGMAPPWIEADKAARAGLERLAVLHERAATASPAGRARLRALVREVRDAEPVEQLECPGAPLPTTAAAQRVGHVLPHAQVREQRVLLEHVAAAAQLGVEIDAALGVEPDLVAAQDAALFGAHQPGDGPQHRRLAGAGRSREREARAGGDLEGDVERERPERRLSANAQHRRARTSR